MSRKRLQLLKQSVQIYSKELSVWAQLLPNYKEYKTPGTISSRNFYINGYETSNENTYWNSTVDGLSGLPSFFNERENINANVNYRVCIKNHIHFIQCLNCSGIQDNIKILGSEFKEY